MKKNVIIVAVNCFINFTKTNKTENLTVDQLQYAVKSATEKQLNTTFTKNEWNWTAVVQELIKTVMLTPEYFGTFKTFCTTNEQITKWLCAICGEFAGKNNTYNYFRYHVVLAYHIGMVVSKKDQTEKWTKTDIVNYLTKKANNYLEKATNSQLTPAGIENMLKAIVSETFNIINTTDSTILEEACFKINRENIIWNSTEEINNYVSSYSETIWGIKTLQTA